MSIRDQLRQWHRNIPDIYHGSFRKKWIKALKRKGMKAAIIAKCQDCQCWQNTEIKECNIVTCSQLTEGAACTVLLAAEYFNNEDELLIANSDQFVDMDIGDFIEDSRKRNLDGNILTFQAFHPKWSYAKLDDEGLVMEVAEKKPISRHATVGIYYYGQGKMFYEAACEMIKKDIRVKNEFYVCPVLRNLGPIQLIVNLDEIADIAGVLTTFFADSNSVTLGGIKRFIAKCSVYVVIDKNAVLFCTC